MHLNLSNKMLYTSGLYEVDNEIDGGFRYRSLVHVYSMEKSNKIIFYNNLISNFLMKEYNVLVIYNDLHSGSLKTFSSKKYKGRYKQLYVKTIGDIIPSITKYESDNGISFEIVILIGFEDKTILSVQKSLRNLYLVLADGFDNTETTEIADIVFYIKTLKHIMIVKNRYGGYGYKLNLKIRKNNKITDTLWTKIKFTLKKAISVI
jgi:hypothetical protein